MMDSQEKTIKFVTKNGKSEPLAVKSGETVMDCAKTAGIELDAPCAGNGTCGKCRVRVISGPVEMTENSLKAAKSHISEGDFAAGWRLACGLTVTGPCEIEIP